MEQSEVTAASRSLDGKAKRSSRWGWSSAATTTNPRDSNSSLASASVLPSAKEKEEANVAKSELGSILEAAPRQEVPQRSEKDRSMAADTGHQPVQTQLWEDEATVSAPKPKSAMKPPAINCKSAQEEPEVRINIIVDPDSGETVGTVTLMGSSSTRPNSLGAMEGPNSNHETTPASPMASKEDLAAFEEPKAGDAVPGLTFGEEVSSVDSNRMTPHSDEHTSLEGPPAVPDTASTSLPADLYLNLTPREAVAERKRLEGWINWAVVTGRDPTIWRQKSEIAKQMAARRRVLQHRALVYGQRVKDAVLAREGHHATHASFEQLKMKQ